MIHVKKKTTKLSFYKIFINISSTVLLYATDTTLYRLHVNVSDFQWNPTTDLQKVAHWVEQNNLKINVQKDVVTVS